MAEFVVDAKLEGEVYVTCPKCRHEFEEYTSLEGETTVHIEPKESE